MADDRIKREIEDILNRLDDFVPEERSPVPFRKRSPKPAGAFWALLEPLAHISLRHVMLTALALVIVGFFGTRAYPGFGQWVLIAGLILFATTFALSFFGRKAAPQYEKRWRGQPMDLAPPTLGDRLRAWLEAKRRQRR